MKTAPFSSKRFWLLAILMAFFLFRFAFGLYTRSVAPDVDYIQTYVIGLKCFTTHTWPYYGPDVVGLETQFKTQIPGALEGLLIALPLWLWPSPESPYFFLNLLTFPGLIFFAWYCCKRLPRLSPWFIFIWIGLAPWSTHFSTQVINPSYAFPGSILFFIGFLETVSIFRINAITVRWANVLMGFGFCWVMQLHMVWLAFVPFLLFSLYSQTKENRWKLAFLFTFLGALPPLTLLIPTFAVYGLNTGRDVHGFASGLNWANAADVVGTLARFLSIASFEMPVFIGAHTHDRIQFLLAAPWLLLPGFLLWLVGYLQPLGMVGFWFLPHHRQKNWVPVKWLALAAFLLIYGCFLFSPDRATSFRIVLFFPVVMLYSLYIYDYLAVKPLWRKIGFIFIILVVFFQIGYAVQGIRAGDSVYGRGKALMAQAIDQKDYRLLAPRRPGSLY
jgi:hypothetical protein